MELSKAPTKTFPRTCIKISMFWIISSIFRLGCNLFLKNLSCDITNWFFLTVTGEILSHITSCLFNHLFQCQHSTIALTLTDDKKYGINRNDNRNRFVKHLKINIWFPIFFPRWQQILFILTPMYEASLEKEKNKFTPFTSKDSCCVVLWSAG